MKILAVDTTTDLGSLALVVDDRVVEEVVLTGNGFADVVFGEIESLLTRHGLAIRDVDGFTAASGPGTFTGVRVGLTAVKGLAEATSRKVVAVSNLKAMAFFGVGELRAPMLDARRGDVYGALYNAQLETVQDEVVMKRDLWIAGLPSETEVISEPRALAGSVARIAMREFSAGLGLDPAEVDANYVRRSDAEMMWKDSK